jgi:energy-coupling factor transporter transmembrane protein EcfT
VYAGCGAPDAKPGDWYLIDGVPYCQDCALPSCTPGECDLGENRLSFVGVVTGETDQAAKVTPASFVYMKVVGYVVLFLVLALCIWFTSFADFGDIEGAFEWHTLFHLWPAWLPGGPRVPFMLEGAIYGLSLGLRLAAIALAFPILVMATHPSDLATALAEIRIGSWRIPYNLIFVFTSALRYIPTISREFDHTIDAQHSRGVEFEGYNIVNQVRAAMPLFVPVLTSSLVRAQDLTIALETRAFGATGERTFGHEVRWRPVDWAVSWGQAAHR